MIDSTDSLEVPLRSGKNRTGGDAPSKTRRVRVATRCPHCNAKLAITTRRLGKPMACPRCLKTFTPQTADGIIAPGAAPKTPTATATATTATDSAEGPRPVNSAARPTPAKPGSGKPESAKPASPDTTGGKTPGPAPAAKPSSAKPSSAPPGAPTHLGRFKLIAPLGEGSGTRVYEAEDPVRKRTVAVKLLLPAFFARGRKSMARFLRRARSACGLEHANLVTLYQIGCDAGAWYAVMKMVRGQSAAEFLKKRGRMTPAGAVQVALDVAKGLAFAHAEHVIHCDVKPSNILLGTGKSVRLTDLGLARIEDTESGEVGRPTGSPAYLSPEGCRGEAMDPRSDLYSLGAVLYTLLTAEPPFKASNAQAVMFKQIYEPVPDPRAVAPDLPRSLADVVFKAMEKDPVRRYQTAEELIAALQAVDLADQEQSDSRDALMTLIRGVQQGSESLNSLEMPALLPPRRPKSERASRSGKNRVARPPLPEVRPGATPVLPPPVTKPPVRPASTGKKAVPAESVREPSVSSAEDVPLPSKAEPAPAPPPSIPPAVPSVAYSLPPKVAAARAALVPNAKPKKPLDPMVIVGGLLAVVIVGIATVVFLMGVSHDAPPRVPGFGGPSAKTKGVGGGTGTGTPSLKSPPTIDPGTTPTPDPKTRPDPEPKTDPKAEPKTDPPVGKTDPKPPAGEPFPPSDGSPAGDFARLSAMAEAAEDPADDPGKIKVIAALRTFADRVKEHADPAVRLLGNRSRTLADGLEAIAPTRAEYTRLRTALLNAQGADGDKAALSDALRGLLEFHAKHAASPQKPIRETAEAAKAAADTYDLPSLNTRQVKSDSAGAAVWCLAVTPDGRRVAGGGLDDTVRVWDVWTGWEARRLAGHVGYVAAVAVAPDGRRLASASWDGTVRVWDWVAGKPLHRLDGHAGPVTGVVFVADGRQVLSAGRDGTLRLWDAETGKPAGVWEPKAGALGCLAATADGSRIAAGAADRSVRVFDAAGKEVARLDGHAAPVRGLAFSPDGRRIATAGGDDHTVRVWDAADGRELLRLEGHAKPVTAAAFHPDGRLLCSAGRDDAVRVWDTLSGKEIKALTDHSRGVYAVAASPDGRWLVSAGGDRMLRFAEAPVPGEKPTDPPAPPPPAGPPATAPDGLLAGTAGAKSAVYLVSRSPAMAAAVEALNAALLDTLGAPGGPARANVIWYGEDEPVIAAAGLPEVGPDLRDKVAKAAPKLRFPGPADPRAAAVRAMDLKPEVLHVVADEDFDHDLADSLLKKAAGKVRVCVVVMSRPGRMFANLKRLADETKGTFRALPPAALAGGE